MCWGVLIRGCNTIYSISIAHCISSWTKQYKCSSWYKMQLLASWKMHAVLSILNLVLQSHHWWTAGSAINLFFTCQPEIISLTLQKSCQPLIQWVNFWCDFLAKIKTISITSNSWHFLIQMRDTLISFWWIINPRWM